MTIEKDILYINFIENKPNLSKHRKDTYISSLNKLVTATQLSLKELIDNCKSQQNRIIEKIITNTTHGNEQIIEKEVIQFDVNDIDSNINQYINTFINYCKQKNNSNSTINKNLSTIKTFFRYYGVQFPKREQLEDDTKKWHLLKKEDINYILNDSTLTQQALITFLIETGFRIEDAINITIGDFMNATSEYHNYINVDDFIDNASDDMFGVWDFIPHKTKKRNIRCVTYNGPSASKRILQNLRKIKNEYFPNIETKKGIKLKFSKDDPLFGTRTSYFKENSKPGPMATIFKRKDNKLKEHQINQIKNKIESGEVSADDYEKLVAELPRFHAHACRKYFETMISRNCGDLRLCLLMEGHTSPVKTDSSYIEHDVEDVKEVYYSAYPDLSVDNVETRVYTSDVRKEMEDKINALQNQNEDLESKLKELGDIEERIDKKIRDALQKSDNHISNDEYSDLFS